MSAPIFTPPRPQHPPCTSTFFSSLLGAVACPRAQGLLPTSIESFRCDCIPSMEVNGMPTFGTVPIGEAHGDTVTGQRAALLQEYVGYIQRVGPGQAGKLEPGEGDPAQAHRGGRDAGEDPGVPPFRRRHLLLAAGGPAPRQAPQGPGRVVNLGGRRLGWRSPANHPPPEDTRNEALGPRRFLDDSARRVAARRSGDAVQVPGRGIITAVARGAPPATPRYPRGANGRSSDRS